MEQITATDPTTDRAVRLPNEVHIWAGVEGGPDRTVVVPGYRGVWNRYVDIIFTWRKGSDASDEIMLSLTMDQAVGLARTILSVAEFAPEHEGSEIIAHPQEF